VLLGIRRGELGPADVDRQHGEPLGHVVVQLAGEQRAFLLVGPDQAPAQVVQRLLEPLLLVTSRKTPYVATARPVASRRETPARW